MSKIHIKTYVGIQQVKNHSLPLNMVSKLLGSGFGFSCLITLPMMAGYGACSSTDAGILNAYFTSYNGQCELAFDSPTANATTVLILQLPLS